MATMVEFDRFSAEDRALFVFRVMDSYNHEKLYVENFYNGIAKIWHEEYAQPIITETLAGCFDEKSNFASELCKIFLNDDETMQTDTGPAPTQNILQTL